MHYCLPYYPRLNAARLFGTVEQVMDRVFNGLSSVGDIPSVDIREETDRYILEAELPGLTEKEVRVTVNQRVLTIASDTKRERSDADRSFRLRERRYAAFERSFELPDEVVLDTIEARFENGLLTIEIPKGPEAQSVNVPIKVA